MNKDAINCLTFIGQFILVFFGFALLMYGLHLGNKHDFTRYCGHKMEFVSIQDKSVKQVGCFDLNFKEGDTVLYQNQKVILTKEIKR